MGCEIDANLASAAQRIVGSTPFADRIRIIDGSSTAAIAHGLLPLEPDVIFTETLDCGVVGEGFRTIADDIRRIAGAHTVTMPSTVRQFATLVESISLTNSTGPAPRVASISASSTPTRRATTTRSTPSSIDTGASARGSTRATRCRS